MKRITETGIASVDNETFDHTVLQSHSKDIHYLAFDRQLGGFSPLGCFINTNKNILENERRIMQALLEKREVCSLYPEELLTLYPIELVEDGNGYNVLLENVDENFELILHYNDDVYKTKYMYVDFGHGANNLKDESKYALVLEKLRTLKKNSRVLKEIFLD